MGFMKAKTPKPTAEELALTRAQTAELSRTQDELTERRRRIIRAQVGGRGSLLSGSERGIRPGESRAMVGSTGGGAGRSGGTGSGRAGAAGYAGGAMAGGGGLMGSYSGGSGVNRGSGGTTARV
jgi:hypothetical protein